MLASIDGKLLTTWLFVRQEKPACARVKGRFQSRDQAQRFARYEGYWCSRFAIREQARIPTPMPPTMPHIKPRRRKGLVGAISIAGIAQGLKLSMRRTPLGSRMMLITIPTMETPSPIMKLFHRKLIHI